MNKIELADCLCITPIYVSGLVGSNADNIGIRPSVGQVELVWVVGGDALRADRQDPLVLSLPCRVLCHEETLQLNIFIYFTRCSHLSLRGTFCIIENNNNCSYFFQQII